MAKAQVHVLRLVQRLDVELHCHLRPHPLRTLDDVHFVDHQRLDFPEGPEGDGRCAFAMLF